MLSACVYLVGLIAELRSLHSNPRPLTLLHMGASAPSSVRVMTDFRPEAFPEQAPCWGWVATDEQHRGSQELRRFRDDRHPC